jgi:DNA-binding IclR family transcriptional regulator
MAAKGEIVNSISKSAEILKHLSDGVDRFIDLSMSLQLSKSTTHRLLKTLEMTGLVTRDPVKRRYHLGPLFLKLAAKPFMIHQNLIVCASDEMKRLRDFSGETVVLHIRIGLERLCLEEFQSLESLKYTSGKGFLSPIYRGSAGKVLLSQMDDGELNVLLNNIVTTSYVSGEIPDREPLLKAILNTRKDGFATSFGERIRGSSSISVPIRDYVCPVALSVLGPESRFSLNVMMEVLKELKEAASRIQRKLKGGNSIERKVFDKQSSKGIS